MERVTKLTITKMRYVSVKFSMKKQRFI